MATVCKAFGSMATNLYFFLSPWQQVCTAVSTVTRPYKTLSPAFYSYGKCMQSFWLHGNQFTFFVSMATNLYSSLHGNNTAICPNSNHSAQLSIPMATVCKAFGSMATILYFYVSMATSLYSSLHGNQSVQLSISSFLFPIGKCIQGFWLHGNQFTFFCLHGNKSLQQSPW